MRRYLFLVISIFIFAASGFTCTQETLMNQNSSQEVPEPSQIGVVEPKIEELNVNKSEEGETAEAKFFSTAQLGEIDNHLQFSADIPTGWEVEYVPEIQSINFFDPTAVGENNLDKSQVFVRYFVASQFLTLQTVTIHSRSESTLNGKPVVTYDIERKSGVADFPSQPSWRNERHTVVDIRSTDESPTVFYVFGLRPELDTQISQAFLASVSFEEQALLYYPIEQFTEQATKKLFGTYITPATSPIQPERFSGYHTGIDVETTEAQQSEDVPIFAVADGTLNLKKTASGYGGVIGLNFSFQGKSYTAIYGHIRLSSVTLEVGEHILAGQQLGVLGTGFSDETDGERKHLHFGLVPGDDPVLLGYVDSQSELSAWVNPTDFFSEYTAKNP